MLSPMADLNTLMQKGRNIVAFFDDGSSRLAVRTSSTSWAITTALPDFPSGGDGGDDALTLIVPLPTSFTGTLADGSNATLNATQITRAGQIVTYGSRIAGVNRAAVLVAIVAALTESSLRNLSNVTAYPESGSFPDVDGDGSDHDSVGLWQMRPSTGWGTVAECMDIQYQTSAWFGGPDGPNGGSPAGLLDIDGWKNMTPGEAAQAVEVSAQPDAYDRWAPFAESLLNAILTDNTDESLTWPFPLSSVTSEYGQRTNPVTGQLETRHDGMDFGQPSGTPIHAAAAGTVFRIDSDVTVGYGHAVFLHHTLGGRTVTTFYGHMRDVPLVNVGDTVEHWEQIGVVGTTGLSTGNHLHFGTWDGPTIANSVNPRVFMSKYGAVEAP